MPDLDKKKSEQDAVSDVPPLDKDISAKTPSEPEEPKTVPPDLVPVPDKDSPPEAEPTPRPNEDEPTPFDDEKTDKAIDEIIAKEGDDILALQDASATKGGVKPPKHHSVFGRFVRSKWTWRVIVLLLLGGLTAVAVTPRTRYLALNTAGVTSSSSVVVVDSTTELPLKGVAVSLAGKKITTDKDGRAKLTKLKLGPATLQIVQVGFAPIEKNVIIGWGSNPLGNFPLKASGVQFVIQVSDYLSEKPLEGVEATDGDVTAISDKKGKITLTLPSALIAKDGITLSKSGYREEKITLNADPKKATKATMVLARQAVFVVKQSGRYDVYRSDIDGTNREVLLRGTGHENSNISLAVSPDGLRAALVSTRDNKRDSGGFLLSSLLLINTESGATVTIAQAAQIQLIDWAGQRIIYQLSASDSSSGKRYTIASYNYPNNARLQLAATNSLSAVLSAQGQIYYSIVSDASNPSLQTGLFSIKPEGTGNKRLVDGAFTTVLRSTYDTLSLQAENGAWHAYDLPGGPEEQIDAPSDLRTRLYLDNAKRTHSLWINQGSLKDYDIAGRKDTDVKTESGLTYPLYWLNDSVVVYRLSTGLETADYAFSLEGGQPHKIADVAPTYGFAQAQ